MAGKQSNGSETPLRQPGQGASSSGQATQAVERRTGRRNDPSYTQVAAYIPQNLYKQVKMKLLQEAKSRNFSELMEDLLVEYVRNQLTD